MCFLFHNDAPVFVVDLGNACTRCNGERSYGGGVEQIFVVPKACALCLIYPLCFPLIIYIVKPIFSPGSVLF